MNVNDSEIVEGILQTAGLRPTQITPDILLINTCAIRENAEQKIWDKLKRYKATESSSTIAVLGCMAERLKSKLLETDHLAHIVVGPDAYKSLPGLIKAVRVDGSASAMDVQLSLEETYSDITPVRHNGVSAYVSIMRGCNNMCSFCVVPFTRGRERSRAVTSLRDEVLQLQDQGIKEITLLG
jgi:tRNA-2-methylthio-N6-dimethylallyladenosine synthase